MNYAQIAGRLGKDPEVRFTPEGRKVTTFNVATNKKKKGQEITTWYRVTVWGDQFDKMISYLKKGSAVVAVGDLEARLYTDKEGRSQISLELTAWNLSFSPFGKGTEGSDGEARQEEFAASEPMRGSMQPSYVGAGPSMGSDATDDSDQIPF